MSKPERRDLPQQPPGARPAPAPEAKVEAKPKPKPAPKPKRPSPWPWGPAARVFASLAIVYHIAAVFSAPWFIQLESSVVNFIEPGGVPRDAQGRPLEGEALLQYPKQFPVLPELLWKPFNHYSNFLYLNNGYNFFSPDPALSHLIDYQVFDAAGQEIAKGRLPDRREQWPRLLYHRYMMLVDQSHDPERRELAGWETHIAEQLLEAHNGQRIRMELIRHHLLTPAQILAGEKITASNTYESVGAFEHVRREPPTAGDAQPGSRP